MPSNKELIERIKEIDPQVRTEGLVNRKLVEILKGLEVNAPVKEPEVKEPEVKEPEVKEPEVKEPEVKEVQRYRVAVGRAIVGRRGILGPGEAISEVDGADLDRLLKGGFIELA